MNNEVGLKVQSVIGEVGNVKREIEVMGVLGNNSVGYGVNNKVNKSMNDDVDNKIKQYF